MQGYFEHSIEAFKQAGIWLLLGLLFLSLNTLGWLGWIRGGLERRIADLDAQALRIVRVSEGPFFLWKQLTDGRRRLVDLEDRLALMAVQIANEKAATQELTHLQAMMPFLIAWNRETTVVRLIETQDETRIAIKQPKMITQGMAIVDAKGVLVGRVTTIGQYTAVVERPFDRDARIPVRSVDGTVRGVLTGDGRRTFLTEVLQGEPLERGVVLVTSGVNGVFPDGVVVGQVEQITGTASEVTKGGVVSLLHTGGDWAVLLH